LTSTDKETPVAPRPKSPERKSANVTMKAKSYDQLAKTALAFRWTVPQYLGFVGEMLADKSDKDRRRMVVDGLGLTETVPPAEPPIGV